MTELKPVGVNILLEELKREKTESGLYNPDESNVLKVVSLGSNSKIGLKVGDKVILSDYHDYTFVQRDGRMFTFVDPIAILGIEK